MHISLEMFAIATELLTVLGVMVLVHEFGHFTAAKLSGVRVETFSIGFGKRLFGLRRGDTDYRVSLLPLGGYVKMAGENPGEQTSGDPGEFNSHPRWQRAVIALAGPCANFLLCFLLLTGLGLFHNEVEVYRQGPATVDYVPMNSIVAATGLKSGDTIVAFDHHSYPTWEDILDDTLTHLNRTVQFSYEHDGHRVDTTLPLSWTRPGPETFDPYEYGFVPKEQDAPVQVAPTPGSVMPNMPGAEAGLQPGDTLIAFNDYAPHSVQALESYLQDQHGQLLRVHIMRHGQSMTLNIRPELTNRGTRAKAYQIGFLPLRVPFEVKRISLGAAIAQGARRSFKDASLIVDVLMGMFERRVSVRSVAGPIGMGWEVHQAFALPGWAPVIEVVAFISVNLGIFNLLPLPILDGGMILFLAIEALMRRDVNSTTKERVFQVAFVCIVLLAAFVIFNDVTRLGLLTNS